MKKKIVKISNKGRSKGSKTDSLKKTIGNGKKSMSNYN